MFVVPWFVIMLIKYIMWMEGEQLRRDIFDTLLSVELAICQP